MIKIVIDTNVFVSALNFGGTPSKVLNLVNEGIIELIISPFILDELSKVLTRQFNWAEDKVKSAISAIKEISSIAKPNQRLSIIKEKDSDNRILECAVCGKAKSL